MPKPKCANWSSVIGIVSTSINVDPSIIDILRAQVWAFADRGRFAANAVAINELRTVHWTVTNTPSLPGSRPPPSACSRASLPYRPHPFEVLIHAASERGHFVGELRQRGGVAFGELADAASEGLRDAVEFALHGGGEGGQPFVVHDERLDFVLGELGVFGIELRIQLFLRGFEPGFGVRLLVEQGGVVFQGLALVGVVRVLADLLEARLHGLGGDLLLLALALDHFREQPFLTALLLSLFVELLFDGGEFAFDGGDGISLGSEIAVNENRRGDEVGLEAALALLEVVRFGPDEFVLLVLHLEDLARLRARLPPFGGDEIAIVLHGLGPVVHEVLIDVVGIEKRRGLECGEQILGDGFDERLGMAVFGESLELRGVGFLPLGRRASSRHH